MALCKFYDTEPGADGIQPRSGRLATRALTFDDSGICSDDPGTPIVPSPLKRHFLTPTKQCPASPARSKSRTPPSPRSPHYKRARVARRARTTPITTQLRGLSKDQLVYLLSTVLATNPLVEQEVCELLPAPDLRPLEATLVSLRKNIYKAMPARKFGGSMTRGAPAFHTVKTHLNLFKKTLTEQGRDLLTAEAWTSAIDYTLLAWKHVGELPDWEIESHRHIKAQCFSNMAAQCSTALKKVNLEKEQYMDIRTRMQSAVKLNPTIEPCLTQIDKILDTLP